MINKAAYSNVIVWKFYCYDLVEMGYVLLSTIRGC